MKAEQINHALKVLYDKSATTDEEKRALLEACGCVWQARMDKVVGVGSFMKMLYAYMGADYDIEVKTTETETVFCVKTFKKEKGSNRDG